MLGCWARDPAERLSGRAILEKLVAHQNALTDRRRITSPWADLNGMRVQVTRNSFAQDEKLMEIIAPRMSKEDVDVLLKLEVPKGVWCLYVA